MRKLRANLQLALTQANEQLNDANDNRRAVDDKVYAVLSLSLTVIGVLAAVRPWTFVTHPLGRIILLSSGVFYVETFLIGLGSYFPRSFSARNSQTIMDNLAESNDWLTLWTTKDILRASSQNSDSTKKKASMVTIAIFVFIVATTLLAISVFIGGTH